MRETEQAAVSTGSSNSVGACIACNGKRLQKILSDPAFEIKQCLRCRLSRTEPVSYVRQSSYADSPQFSESYDSRENDFRGYAQRLLKPLQRHQGTGKLLDVGCSVGILVDEAEKLGYQADGIDLDEVAVEMGRKRKRSLSFSKLEDWPSQDYDVICASHTVEHLLEPVEFLRAAYRHLRAEGYLAVVVPCHRGLHPRLFGKRWYGWIPRQHYYHYSTQGMQFLLEKAGFRVVDVWQESMDYRLKLSQGGAWHFRMINCLEYLVASIGGIIGAGDQLVVIAQRCK